MKNPKDFIRLDKVPAVIKALRDLVPKQVLVGIPESKTERQDDEGEDGPMTNAMLGYIQEHGSPAQNIPARPFLVPGIKDAQEAIEARLSNAANAAMSGKRSKVEEQLNAAGIVAQNSVRRKINSGEFAPLALSTLQARARRGRKGAKAELESRAQGNEPNNDNAKPLIDTGQMRNSITYVIRKK